MIGLRIPSSLQWRLERLEPKVWPFLPDRVIYERRFRRTFGYPIDWRRPKSFNEKILWLMRYYRWPIMTQLVDKHAVRDYVTKKVGPHFLNELYGVWEDPHQIRFETLPRSFVLKATHAWAMNFFCRDRVELDERACRQQLGEWLKYNHYLAHREWAYKHVRPRIIAERLLVDATWGTPPDYKFFCFSGQPRFIQVDTDRFTDHRRDFFDVDWNILPFTVTWPRSGRSIPRPANLEEMVECAQMLAAGFPFVRVDFYSCNGQTIFGEMTWYPDAGITLFSPESYDEYWGRQIQLPPVPPASRESAA